MRVVIASDADGMSMKESIKEMLIADGHESSTIPRPLPRLVDSATAVAKDLLEHKDSQGFAFDKYGVGSYMAAVKIKGMVVANISDERSAYMTREHNGSRMVTMGPGVWAPRSPRRSPASSCAPVRRRPSPDPCRHAQQDGLTRATENSNFYLNL
mgnify:CR=1 FL=1